MALGINVGSVHVSIAPNLTGFAPAMEEGVNKEVPSIGAKASAKFSEGFSKSGTQSAEYFVRGLNPVTGQSIEYGRKAGLGFAEAFSKEAARGVDGLAAMGAKAGTGFGASAAAKAEAASGGFRTAGERAGSSFATSAGAKAESAVLGFSAVGGRSGQGFSAKFSEQAAAGLGTGSKVLSTESQALLGNAMAGVGVAAGGRYSEKFEEEAPKVKAGNFATRLTGALRGDVEDAAKELGGHFGQLFTSAIGGVGGGLLAAAAVVGVTVEATKKASDLKEAQDKLDVAMKNAHIDGEKFAGTLSGLQQKGEKYGATNAQVDESMARLITATGSTSAATRALNEAYDIAAFKHISLDEAVGGLTKAYAGNARGLKDLGILVPPAITASQVQKEAISGLDKQYGTLTSSVKGHATTLANTAEVTKKAQQLHLSYGDTLNLIKSAEGGNSDALKRLGADTSGTAEMTKRYNDVLDKMNPKLKDQATVAAETLSGKMAALRATVSDLLAHLGSFLLPLLTKLVGGMLNAAKAVEALTHWFERHKTVAKDMAIAVGILAIAIGGALVAALGAAVGAFIAANAATLGIGAAIALLITGVVMLITHWRAVWDEVKRIASDVLHFLQGWGGLILLAVFGPIIGGLLILVLHWRQTWDAIKGAALEVWNWLKSTWSDVTNAMRGIFESFSAVVKATWQIFWNGLKDTAMLIWDLIKAGWQLLTTTVRAIFDVFSGVLRAAWTAFWTIIRDTASAIWDALKLAWQTFTNIVRDIFQVFSDIFHGRWSQVWNDIKNIATTIWDALKQAWQIFLNLVRSIYDSISGALKTAWHDFWQGLHDVAKGIWDAVNKAWNDTLNTVRHVWDTISGAFKGAWHDFWQGLVDTAKNIWNTITDIFSKPVNVIVGIWNKIAGAFGLPTIGNVGGGPSGGSLAAPGSTPASGSSAHRAFAAGGPVFGAGTATSDSIPALLSNGEYVMPASAVKHYGQGIFDMMRVQKFGIGGIVNNIIGAPVKAAKDLVKGAISAVGTIGSDLIHGDVTGAINAAIGALGNISANVAADSLKPILDGIVAAVPNPVPGVQGMLGALPHNALKAIEDGVMKALQSVQSSAQSSGPGGNGSPPAAGQPAAAVAYARTLVGQIGGDMTSLIKLWNQESGWNANAVNPSSGAYGIPQALGHGHPYNLGDYKAQVDWGINYIKGRYGTAAAAWAHEQHFNWYDNGGMWPSGTLGVNMTGRDEGVLTPRAVDSIGGPGAVSALNSGAGLGATHIELKVYIGNEQVDGHIDARVAGALEGVANQLAGGLKVGG